MFRLVLLPCFDLGLTVYLCVVIEGPELTSVDFDNIVDIFK